MRFLIPSLGLLPFAILPIAIYVLALWLGHKEAKRMQARYDYLKRPSKQLSPEAVSRRERANRAEP